MCENGGAGQPPLRWGIIMLKKKILISCGIAVILISCVACKDKNGGDQGADTMMNEKKKGKHKSYRDCRG